MLAHAEQGGINGVGLDRFPGTDALFRPHEATARGNAVDGGMDGIKRRDRQHRGVHVKSEGKANPDGGTSGIEPVGAAGAKIGVVVPVAPHFDMPDKKSGERMAGLHTTELSVRGHLRMNKNVMQIRAGQGPLRPLIGLQGGFDGGIAVGVDGYLNARGMIVHDKVAELFRRTDQLAAVTGAGVVIFKQGSGVALDGTVRKILDAAETQILGRKTPQAVRLQRIQYRGHKL